MIKKLLLLLCVALLIPFAAACQSTGSTSGGLPADGSTTYDNSDGGLLGEAVAGQIKQAFYASEYNDGAFSSADEVVIYEYFGKFGSSYVVDIAVDPAITVCLEETVEGCYFFYPNPTPLLLYNQGKFYRLQEAFDSGLINKADVEKVHENFGGYLRQNVIA